MTICHRASQTFKTFNEVKDQFAKLSLKLQAVKVGSKKRTTKDEDNVRIGDPIVLETGRGKPKRTKRQVSSSYPTHVSNEEDFLLDLTGSVGLSGNIDHDTRHTNATPKVNLVGYMPNTYKENDIFEVSKFGCIYVFLYCFIC